MFVRTKVIRSGEKEYRYLQLVENQRVKGRVKQKVIFTLGRVESIDPNQVDQIVAAFGKYTQYAHVLRRIEALQRDADFLAAYAAALEAYRAGHADAVFPTGTFKLYEQGHVFRHDLAA